MCRSLSFLTFAAAACAGALLLPSTGRAQNMWWGGDAYWASRPGVYTPWNGMPISERMTDASLIGMSDIGRDWRMVVAIDHEERLEKFGTRYGPDHPPLFNRILDRWHRR